MPVQPTLHFAHITDVHISNAAQSWGGLGDQADALLVEACQQLNAIADLDFVLLTGDVIDSATPDEVARLRAALETLEKPWHFVPGNHDGFIDPNRPEAYRPHEALPLFDPRLADPVPHAQQARWVRQIRPGVRLIGLDTRKPDDWGGVVDGEQMAWLRAALSGQRDDLVIVAMHHPVHHLGPHSQSPGYWTKFVCDNAAEIDALFDAHPQVRLVLAGHHHANHLRLHNGRLHVNTAALSGYPCQYRTIRMTPLEVGWRTEVMLHPVGDEATRARAFDVLAGSSMAQRFDSGDWMRWARFCEGSREDQAFDRVLE